MGHEQQEMRTMAERIQLVGARNFLDNMGEVFANRCHTLPPSSPKTLCCLKKGNGRTAPGQGAQGGHLRNLPKYRN